MDGVLSDSYPEQLRSQILGVCGGDRLSISERLERSLIVNPYQISHCLFD
ncbi:MAG: hypothetical protein AB4290_14830 [Spirulina sp.]